MPGTWMPEPFEAGDGTIPFERRLDNLSGFKVLAFDTAIHWVLSARRIDLVWTE